MENNGVEIGRLMKEGGRAVATTIASGTAHERLIRRLQAHCSLSPVEIEALQHCPLTTRMIQDNSDIVREGDRPTECCLLVEGFLFRYKMLDDGSRQILSLHVPGDMPDLQGLYLEVMDHSLGALAPSRVAMIPHAAILDLIRRFPGIAAALWRETLIDGSIFREWLSNVGRRPAYERAAHLFCEFFVKMKLAGLAKGDSCDFPLSQQELGDALGLSVVHVNRTVQQLRSKGLVHLSSRSLSIPDFGALQAVGGFDDKYLHMKH